VHAAAALLVPSALAATVVHGVPAPSARAAYGRPSAAKASAAVEVMVFNALCMA
jgi:hypothetical protein